MRDVLLPPREAQLAELERLIRRDPARRGLIEAESQRGPLCPGHLAAAADHIARFGRSIGIVTGFYIPGAEPPAAETDGPPGAALLAIALSKCGMDVRLMTDVQCAPAVASAAREYGLPSDCVVSATGDETAVFFPPDAARLSHLIAVERVGPAHSLRSYAGRRPETDPDVQAFRRTMPFPHEDRCHNMRGEIIDAHTAPLHRVFETVSQLDPGVRTIGIGDGGNEIGMGSVPWDELRQRLNGPSAPLVPCRVPTDWTIVAGVSNWGAQALAVAVCHLRGETHHLAEFDLASEEHRWRAMVESGPAVDGVTRLREPTVDGLPFLTYIQPWEGMRRVLGL
uniref:DUF4392 domain-containing protein n=1 Tax=Schlesneria paludicola TaxID=360056 RepID=A0A7C2JYK9_9PLAN